MSFRQSKRWFTRANMDYWTTLNRRPKQYT
ncbi:SAM-dependent methyltransferase, partial [Lacticaseibacillus paracasei]